MTQNVLYDREYPIYQTFRIRRTTLDRLKKRGISGQSVNDIIEEMLSELE
jgi:hypothetical protein